MKQRPAILVGKKLVKDNAFWQDSMLRYIN